MTDIYLYEAHVTLPCITQALALTYIHEQQYMRVHKSFGIITSNLYNQ